MPKKKLLIFGSGFMARYIIAEAVSCGDIEVRILYNSHPLVDSPKFIQRSIHEVDQEEYTQEFSPHYIICLQGSSFVPDNKRLIHAIETNVVITLSFLEKVVLSESIRRCLEKIIIVGSAGEYGRTYEEPIAENFPLHPSSIYVLTKIFLFNMAMYYKEKGLPIVYTRQFNCTGPHQRETFLIPSLCSQIARIEKKLQPANLTIGDVTQERDFIDVRDAAKAYLILLSQGNIGEVYNIGSGTSVSVGHVLNTVIECSKLQRSDIHVTVNKDLFSKDHSLSNRILADTKKLQSLHFTPQYTLQQTIRDTLQYWRNNV
jgi:GDP-4-dehydro-6-deoxy-D-mannose reductase